MYSFPQSNCGISCVHLTGFKVRSQYPLIQTPKTNPAFGAKKEKVPVNTHTKNYFSFSPKAFLFFSNSGVRVTPRHWRLWTSHGLNWDIKIRGRVQALPATPSFYPADPRQAQTPLIYRALKLCRNVWGTQIMDSHWWRLQTENKVWSWIVDILTANMSQISLSVIQDN